MSKNIFYNYRVLEDNQKHKKSVQIYNKDYSKNVDIDKLLNAVKINKKIEKKEKIILFGCSLSLIGIMGIFILLVK